MYSINATAIYSNYADFDVNGELIRIPTGNIERVGWGGGLTIGVTETAISDKEAVPDIVTIYLGARKIALQGGDEVEVNGDPAPGCDVKFVTKVNGLSEIDVSYGGGMWLREGDSWADPIFNAFEISFESGYDGENADYCPQDCGATKPTCADGCYENNQCLRIGTRISGTYCSLNMNMQQQKPEGETCDENYECTTNECTEGKCVSSYNLIKQVWCNIYAATSLTASIPEIIAGASISEQFWNSVAVCLGKPTGPDLTVTGAELFNNFEEAGLRVSIRNIGTKSAENLGIYYSVYDNTRNEMVKNGEETISWPISPAGMTWAWINLDSALKPGSYSIWVQADSQNNIQEISEDNNFYSKEITLASYADTLIEDNIGDYIYQSSASQSDYESTFYYAGYKLSNLPDNMYAAAVFEFNNRTDVDSFISLYEGYFNDMGVTVEKQDYNGNTVYVTTSEQDFKGIAWTNGNRIITAGSVTEWMNATSSEDLYPLYDAYLAMYPSDLT
jgi:hypothetical protein